jgi:hypothetical protein
VSTKYALLATEGADDQAVLCSFLQCKGFTLVKYNGVTEAQNSFWGGIFPALYQIKSYHHLKNFSYPSVFSLDDYEVAVYKGEGNNLSQNILDITKNRLEYREDISAFGLIVDADTKQPTSVAKKYADELKKAFPSLSEIPGSIMPGSPRTGIYVWPDNQNSGTLETLLLDCASFIYPDHKKGAERFLNELDNTHTKNLKGAIFNKAIIASIVSVLQPGRANHASFGVKDEWINKLALEKVAGIAQFWMFLHNLLDLAQELPVPVAAG